MWFFEFVFLKGYYGTMKRNDVRKICREIVAGYQRLGSAYETDIDEYARLNGMYVSLYNGSGTLLFTYPNYSGSGVKQNLLTESQRKELLSRLKGDEDNEVCEIAANAENEEDTFVTYGAVFRFRRRGVYALRAGFAWFDKRYDGHTCLAAFAYHNHCAGSGVCAERVFVEAALKADSPDESERAASSLRRLYRAFRGKRIHRA